MMKVDGEFYPTPVVKKWSKPVGRGIAVGYTGAYSEADTVELEAVVDVQNARGPE